MARILRKYIDNPEANADSLYAGLADAVSFQAGVNVAEEAWDSTTMLTPLLEVTAIHNDGVKYTAALGAAKMAIEGVLDESNNTISVSGKRYSFLSPTDIADPPTSKQGRGRNFMLEDVTVVVDDIDYTGAVLPVVNDEGDRWHVLFVDAPKHGTVPSPEEVNINVDFLFPNYVDSPLE